MQRAVLFCALCCACVMGVVACENEPAREIQYDRPALRVPLQVYYGQTFYLDASQSRRPNGEIKGYLFDTGDGSSRIITREPLLAYSYFRWGTVTVRLQLLDGDSVEEATITVVDCNQYLACDAPLRPCPPGFVCNDQNLCAPENPTCITSADCPAGLACRDGACGPGGVCPDFPNPRPNPDLDASLDTDTFSDADTNNNPNTDTNNNPDTDIGPQPGDLCDNHNECAATAFCVNGRCEDAICDDACIDKHLESTELLRIFDDLRVTGLAKLSTFSWNYYVMTLDGMIWRRGSEYSPGMGPNIQAPFIPDTTPPKFIGTVGMTTAESALDEIDAPWPFWGRLDLVYSFDDDVQFGKALALNFLPASEFVPVPTPDNTQASLMVSDIGSRDIAGVRPEWTDGVEPVYNSYYDRNTDVLSLVNYMPAFDIIQVNVNGQSLRDVPYAPLPGLEVCAVAFDGRMVFLAENRVYLDDNAQARMGAGRIVQVDFETGEVVDTWPSVIGPSCALEADLDLRVLLSVQYSVDKNPFLAIYRYSEN